MAARRRFSIFRLLRWVIGLSFLGTLVYLLWLPDVADLVENNPKSTSLMQLRIEQAQHAGKRPKKPLYLWRPIREISQNLVHAILVAEDDRFYQHKGFDLEQIQVAVQRDWEKKKFVYGGSTLTQQLARTLYLSPHKNLLRKAKEAIITYQLEHTLTKRRILELYLNVVEWGNGIYGAEAAARTYFGTSAAELTPDQSVALASILPSPRRWSPSSERSFMARRRTQLTERMRLSGYWPEVSASTTTVDVSTDTVPDLPFFDPNNLSGEAHVAPPSR